MKGQIFGVVVRPIQAFLGREAASGILLLACAVIALLWANLDAASYGSVFDCPLSLGAGGETTRFTVRHLINDGLMAIFFFVVGMEIKRELVTGELNTVGKATLPAVAALGGIVLPAAIFLAFNWGGEGRAGWGIPMATDIAFCVGILTLLKGRVPHGLIVFVTALAIFDDIGGIIVIALFYGHGLSVPWLLGAGVLGLVLRVMNRAHVKSALAYGVVGIALWYALHHGGIHATIAGVILGLTIPARSQRPPREVLSNLSEHVSALDRKAPDEELDAAEILSIEERLEDLQAPVQRFIHQFHPFVAFLIMPLFALANSGVSLAGEGLSTLVAPVTLGTAIGLFVGKQVGIFGLTLLAVRLRLAPMPGAASTAKLYGVSVLSGIGFTVALLIASLAYPNDPVLLGEAKVGVLFGSLVAGIAGFAILRLIPKSAPANGQ
jgi:NhaA family Na+:H+ antiporter